MISRIEAYNYRCFPRLSVDLERFHVLAGANGAGKTTLLDIPVLLGDLLRQRSAPAAFLERPASSQPPRATTLVDLLHKGEGDAIAFAIEAKLPAAVVDALVDARAPIPTHLRYELRLDVGERFLRVADEYLFFFSSQGNLPRPSEHSFVRGQSEGSARGHFFGEPITGSALRRADWRPVILRHDGGPTRFISETTMQAADVPPLRVPNGQPALGVVPPDQSYFPAALWFAQLLTAEAVFYAPEWDQLRRAAPPGDPMRLLPSGRNTPWLALRLQQGDPAGFAAWIDLVRTALPQIASIRAVEREEDHYGYLSVDYVGGYRVTSSGLSDGTLRILALTLLPFLDEKMMPGLLVTEEPENGIHPRAIETVMQSLGSLYDSQVWVSTQSPIVLAHTDLSQVLAARLRDDGSVSVIPGTDHPRLRDWQGSLRRDHLGEAVPRSSLQRARTGWRRVS